MRGGVAALRNFERDGSVGRSGWTFWMGVVRSNSGAVHAEDRRRLVVLHGTAKVLFERILESRKRKIKNHRTDV